MNAARPTPPLTLPLPDGWSDLEVVSDTFVADNVELRRAGAASRSPAGEEITGSAAERDVSPLARAGYELLERAGTLSALATGGAFPTRTRDGAGVGIVSCEASFPSSDAHDRWRFSRSNGVALHTDWPSAARHALEELVERDRVLRSWYGEIRPEPLSVDWSTTPLAPSRSYDWRAVEFAPLPSGWMSDIQVVSVFGFPRTVEAPLVFGHGARSTTTLAFDAALREAMQILSFLWGEPIVDVLPALAPTAAYHLDHWQVRAQHGALRRWLDGDHMRHNPRRPAALEQGGDVTFVDLTPPWLRASGYHLAKAQSGRAMPLAFGDAPFAGHLPRELRIHPIA